MDIIFRNFKESEIYEIDNLFKESMLTSNPNILLSFLIIIRHYCFFIIPGFIISWTFGLGLENIFLFVIFILSLCFYVGVRIFLYFFIKNNLPSFKVKHFINNENRLIVGLDKNNKIVSFCSYIKHDRKITVNNRYWAWMDYFFIDSRHHKKGIGKQMLKYVLDTIEKEYPEDWNNNGEVHGGTSSLQLNFWKKFAYKVYEEQEYYIGNTKINNSLLFLLPIRGYKIIFNKTCKIH